MGKYFITGNAGTGKSTTILALKELGYQAYDIDESPEIRGFLDLKTNKVLDELPEITVHGEAGFTRYTSFIKESGLRKLLDSEQTVIVGGSSTMQEQFYPLFDKIFGLILPKSILEERLANRTNNPTGNNKEDRAWLLSINDRVEANLKAAGAILISADQSLKDVINEILSHFEEEANQLSV